MHQHLFQYNVLAGLGADSERLSTRISQDWMGKPLAKPSGHASASLNPWGRDRGQIVISGPNPQDDDRPALGGSLGRISR